MSLTAAAPAAPARGFAFPLSHAAQGILAGLVVLAIGLWVFGGQAQRGVERAAGAAVAAAGADGAARLLTARITAGDTPVAAAPALQALADVASPGGATVRIVRLEDRTLVASSVPGDTAAGPAPRALALAEKPLFDLSNRMRVDAPADGWPGPLPLGPRASDGALVAAQIWRAQGRPAGHVEVATAPVGVAEPALSRLAPLAVLGLALVAGLALAGFAGSRGRWVALALVAIAGAVATQMALAGQVAALDAAGGAAATQVEAVRAALAEAGIDLAAAPGGLAAASGDDLARSFIALTLLALAATAAFAFGGVAKVAGMVRTHRTAYAYVAPAIILLILLSFVPFLYGVALSFTDTTLLNQGQPFVERLAGIDNYVAILGDVDLVGDGGVANYQNFYWTLGVTILWTVTNVAIGTAGGLALALLLNVKGLKGVAIYRTLLILPWAIPNYITALTWRGLFHPQFGAFNQMIQAFGGEPVAWFDSFGPAFMTGLATNAWLSFPFMMVVCLGALQAIDEDMYEAAKIDGASPWQRFVHITLPSLRPALLPAVIVSVVWTFNMFNVIYLVSAGQPSGSTEILVTRAYKVAFEEYQYGYAAAYSVVIFMILLIYGIFQIRTTKATEAGR